MDEDEAFEWNRRHVEIDEKTGLRSARVLQKCNCCRRQFNIIYFEDGNYEYVEPTVCDCECDFSPVDGPSISQWLESLV